MGFSGRLPNITALLILLAGVGFRIGHLGFLCLALTSDTKPATGIAEVETTGTITGLAFEPNTVIPTTSDGGFGCPFEDSLHFRRNSSSVTVLGASTAITIRLI